MLALTELAVAIAAVVIGAGLLQNAVYIGQLAFAYRALRRKPPISSSDALWRRYGDVSFPIALLVPAYNEAAGIVDSVRSLLALHYPDIEVIVINDGSRDGTLATLIEAFALEPVDRAYDLQVPHKPIRALYRSAENPSLLVIDKENGGKSDALNAGINVARAPLFCAVDADSILEPDALLRSAQPFFDDPKRVVAAGGTIRVANGCTVRRGRVIERRLPRKLLPLFQSIEYLRAFLMARLGWSEINTLTLVSGAFGVFRRSVVLEVGGYAHGTVGEDLELVLKLHRHLCERRRDYAIRFVPEPVCWTEAPESLRMLARQRIRWQRGALETFFRHRTMLFNPRYGRIGALGLGNMLLVDVLGPPIEVLGYALLPTFWYMGALSPEWILAFVATTFLFGVFISVGSLVLEELELRRYPRASDLVVLAAAAVAENFGYRQLNNLWRIVGWWRWLRRAQGWGAMTRTGFRKA